MRDHAIVTTGLTKMYGERCAVNDLDLNVRRGEIFGLLGPNGAGKTTTILMLLGLTTPTAGDVAIAGLDPVHDALRVRARVGYLPDAVGFDGDMTGRQNLRYTARLNRLPSRQVAGRIDEVLTDVDLMERADDPVRAYSRGMRQRLGIADALLKRPQVVVLDEPTTAIDPEGVRDLLSLIKGLPEQSGCTVLLASHLLQQVQEVCDRVGIFVEGRLVAAGTVDELARQHHGRLIIEVGVDGRGERSAPEVIATLGNDIEVRAGDDGDMWLVGTDRDLRRDLSIALTAAGWTVTHLRLRTEDLTDVYHRFFSSEAPS